MSTTPPDLFEHARQQDIEREAPLAHRLRPRTLDEFVGQEHIVGPGRLLRRAIQADQLSSLIFYGPPGTGKTTLAMVIANTTQSHFITINAVLAGVKQIREAIAEAQERRHLYNQRTTLFVDEVHRWNKAQQDALLPHVEKGTIILIGATTENPYFEVNKALVSRSRIFQLKPLTTDDLRKVAHHALTDPQRGYGQLDVQLTTDALEHLVDVANGDARGVLNALELAVETTPPDEAGTIHIDLAVAEESIQRRAVLYDKDGDVHYDTTSAFIKSLRGSDPDAALYWLAKMVYAGEDPRFLFRRMAILAGEDVGMADPLAITVVTSCWEAFERIGLPEGRFPLAQAALYLATCPKSNTTLAFFDALEAVGREQEADVPTHLRDANRDSEGFGHGRGYLYPHAYRDHWVAQQYLPDALQGRLFYQPSDQGYESDIREQVARRREAQLAAMLEGQGQAPPELLTTGPVDQARDRWLQRTIAGTGRNLAQLRDTLFDLAQVQRHHLLLDLAAGSGLLTWEALRRAPEGGVWALTTDQQAGEALRQQADPGQVPGLNQLTRPVILIGTPDELPYLLALRDEADVRFDRILARNPFTRYSDRSGGLSPDHADLAKLVAGLLLPTGRFCIAQVVPRRGQRLHALIDWSSAGAAAPAGLAETVAAAEEALYHDPNDPLVNWDIPDLEAALAAAGFTIIDSRTQRQEETRRLTATQLDRWLGNGENEGTYTGRLGLSPADRETVAALYRRQLTGREVSWSSTTVFFTAGREETP